MLFDILQVGFTNIDIDVVTKSKFKILMETLVELIQETIGSIDFWQNQDKQKKLRGLIKTEITKAGLDELKLNRERVSVEIMKLAKNRHDELTHIVHERTS